MVSILPHDEVKVPLLREEVERYATHQGIQTCTFYSAGHNAAGMGKTYGLVRSHVVKRVEEVLKANPWMAGTLLDTKTLCYTKSIGEAHIKTVLLEEARSHAPFTRNNTYSDINAACLNLGGLCNAAQLVKSGSPISRVVCIPTVDNEVALLFSMSHAVVDGFTYYKLLSMIGGAPIESLTIERPDQKDYSNMETRVSGSPILKYGASGTYIKHIVWNNVLKSKPYNAIIARTVNPEKVEAAKKNTKNLGDQHFVSTNDLLVSQVGNASHVDFMMQTINYRHRDTLLNSRNAGNYENVCAYDQRGYACAGGVRESLLNKPYGNIQQMPGICSKTRMGFYTSWVFQDVPLPTIVDCFIELHMPIMNLDPEGNICNALICPLDVAITFRPQPDKIAMLSFCCRANPSDFVSADSVLGDTVSPEIFPEGLKMKKTSTKIEPGVPFDYSSVAEDEETNDI